MAEQLVNLRLVQGDARDVRAGLAVIGQRSPLRTWLESRGHEFQTTSPRPGRPTASWCSPGDPWPYAVAIKPRVGHVSSTRLADDISEVVGWSLRRWPTTDVVIIPMFWREPELVSFNMLLALWILSFSPEQRVGRARLDVRFTIASDVSVEPFHYWLREDCRNMKAKIAELKATSGEAALMIRLRPEFEKVHFVVAAEAT